MIKFTMNEVMILIQIVNMCQIQGKDVIPVAKILEKLMKESDKLSSDGGKFGQK